MEAAETPARHGAGPGRAELVPRGRGGRAGGGRGHSSPRAAIRGVPPRSCTRAPAPALLTVVIVADFLLAAALTVRHRAAASGPWAGSGRPRRARSRLGRWEGGGGRAGTRDAGTASSGSGPDPRQREGQLAGRAQFTADRGRRLKQGRGENAREGT